MPVCQGESSEDTRQQLREEGYKTSSAGRKLCVCLDILILLLGGIYLFCSESEYTRLNCNKKFFLTQHDDVLDTAINKCIPVWELQDRSHGAKRSNRVGEIRSAMAAPKQVRVKLISRASLLSKCQKLRELINPDLELTNAIAHHRNAGAKSLFDMGIDLGHSSDGEGDTVTGDSAHVDPQQHNHGDDHSCCRRQ